MVGVLRIHFSDRDFRHLQLARSADPVWEAFLALHVLTTSPARVPVRLRPWRRRATERLRDPELRGACRLLHDLAPADTPYFPDFLTPAESAEGMTAALQTLRATPGSRLERELREAARYRPLPGWTRRLATGDRDLLGRIADAVRHFHTQLIAPDWSEVQATVAADRESRLERLEDGMTAVLDTLDPFVRRDSVLSAPYPVDADLWLRGRGVRLIPSFFCHTAPIAIADPRLPPVVVYPVRPTGASVAAPDGRAAALAALLGAGRSRVLGALPAASTTGALALHLGMSASTVSGHLTVLRDSGLVHSERSGVHVVHRVTARGRHLLDG
ncbi:Helix-turn-helix domain protein [Streptomyces sp. YIM 130001]|uniref:ArsR/SmtB family transcription factor n=1 Tax=Streptomyces sp. YIM 130001 TaxID=2259644 RepID=UPI000E64ABDF|nr:helix-turn-helix domain-containing protein [Streptomyces sp. YIM 130001]RII14244.1 Helix-turn-helix domain protein [Streptomyces sp. YIM 130001]